MSLCGVWVLVVRERLQFGAAILAVLASAFLPADAAPARPPRAPALRACIVPQPELSPLFPPVPTPSASDDDEEEDDDDEEEEDEEEEFDEEAIRGWLAPDGVTCIAIGGSVNAGVGADTRAMSKGRITSLRGQDVLSFPYTAIFKQDSVTDSGGWKIGTGVTLAYRSGADPTLDRAMVTIGPMKAGRDVSTFVFFDGADFAFSARTPARQATMFSYRAQLTESLSATFSAENPPDAASAIAAGATISTGARMPDLIGRFLYEGDSLTLHAAGALRELRRTDGGPTRLASAFLLGASREFEIGGVTHTLLAQGGGTLGAPVMIGSQLDSTDALTFLTGGEITNGWSALASISSAWTDTISTSAYASRYALRIPNRSSTTGLIDITRYAANIVWKPAPMVKVGLELGWSNSDITLPRLAMSGATTNRMSTVLWVQKSF